MTTISAQMVKELREETKASMMQCKKALLESKGDKPQAVKLLKEWGISLVSKKSDRQANEGVILLHRFSENHAALVCISCETDFVAKSETFEEFCIQVKNALQEGGISSLQDSKTQELIQEVTGKCGEKIVIGTPVVCNIQGVVGTYLHSTKKSASMIEIECPEILWKEEKVQTMAKDLAMQVVAMSPISVSLELISQETRQEQRSIFAKQMKMSEKPAVVIEKIIEGKLKKHFSEICLLSMPFVKDPSVTVEELVSNCGKSLGHSMKVGSFKRLEVGK